MRKILPTQTHTSKSSYTAVRGGGNKKNQREAFLRGHKTRENSPSSCWQASPGLHLDLSMKPSLKSCEVGSFPAAQGRTLGLSLECENIHITTGQACLKTQSRLLAISSLEESTQRTLGGNHARRTHHWRRKPVWWVTSCTIAPTAQHEICPTDRTAVLFSRNLSVWM